VGQLAFPTNQGSDNPGRTAAMKIRFLLLLPFVLASCAQEYDKETAELSAYYARKGDQMTTTLQRAPKPDPKTGKIKVDPSARPAPTY